MVRLKVRVEILSKEDLNDLEQDVTRLEQLSKRKDIAGGRTISRKGQPRRGTGIFGAEGGEALPSSVLKKRRKAALDRRTEANVASSAKDAISSGTLAEGTSPAPRANAFKALQKQVSLNKKASKAMQLSISQFQQFSALSRGGIGGLVNTGLGIAGKILPVGIAIGIGKMALDIWIASYGAGGVNDPRKKVLDDVSSFIGLERESDIQSGRQFFATSRTLKQGQDIRTNTQDLVDGYTRTKLLRSPYGRA